MNLRSRKAFFFGDVRGIDMYDVYHTLCAAKPVRAKDLKRKNLWERLIIYCTAKEKGVIS